MYADAAIALAATVRFGQHDPGRIDALTRAIDDLPPEEYVRTGDRGVHAEAPARVRSVPRGLGPPSGRRRDRPRGGGRGRALTRPPHCARRGARHDRGRRPRRPRPREPGDGDRGRSASGPLDARERVVRDGLGGPRARRRHRLAPRGRSVHRGRARARAAVRARAGVTHGRHDRAHRGPVLGRGGRGGTGVGGRGRRRSERGGDPSHECGPPGDRHRRRPRRSRSS